jgi:1,4-alpha-glucan branching enzyme
LADNPALRYAGLLAFDVAMQALDGNGLLASPGARLLRIHEDHKLLVFERGGYLFAFNWHPVRSEPALEVSVPAGTTVCSMLLNTDDTAFDGFGIVGSGTTWTPMQPAKEPHIMIHLPARTAMVIKAGRG